MTRSVLFSYAFRPFFLLAGIYAVFMIADWGLIQANVLTWPDNLPVQIRHGHEMLFGFAGAAIAGFLLTAVATWTNRPAISGTPLIGLSAVWIVARCAALLANPPGFWLWSSASILFWSGLTALMSREVMTARNSRNYKVVPLLMVFLGTEIFFFGSAADDVARQETCLRVGVLLIIGMIFLIGGRIIPAFTQNWLRLHRPEIRVQLPTFDRFDLIAIVFTAIFATGFVVWPTSITGWTGILAALLHFVRLARWRGWLARREPLLWILHLGYAWIPVGFGLLGLALTWQNATLYDSGLHALTYGAIGTLILGVAARVALGHTGRPLQTLPMMKVAFGLISLGTCCRLAAPFGYGFTTLASISWISAYAIFLWQYLPILLAPRIPA